MNKEDNGHTGEPMDLESKTVAQLKDMLREMELPVSGTKTQLIDRLEGNSAEGPVLSLEDETKLDDAVLVEENLPWWRSTNVLTPQALMAIGVVVLMITAVFVVRPSWLGFTPNYEYELIDYDASQTRTFAEELVAFGHPDWEGRMSGTVEEANASEYIAAQFEAMGMTSTLHSYQVPMHHVNSEPSLRICTQGFGGTSPCEGPLAFGSQVIQFQHRIDYVIQGFSGRSEYTFQQDVQVTDLGNGSDDALWASASGTIGYVRGGATVGGNTGLFSKAAENNLAGLINVNKDTNCGQIEANDCVPIFKGSRIDEVTEANEMMTTKVAGVVSTNPAHLMNADLAGDFVVTVALTGRVPCKVVGNITKGDMIVTSDVPGVGIAMDNPKLGSVIGKALQDYNSTDIGTIEVVAGRL